MKRKLHWSFWFELSNLAVLMPLNAWIMWIDLRDGKNLLAVLPAMAVLVVAWNSRRLVDFCICQFCIWYMGRKATRMMKKAGFK